ncbi:MAG: hypothetical protein CMJ31_07390 [Phycisphaerae bacterium]|nr:hypothetical protein [Phycisphaerae bacterium]
MRSKRGFIVGAEALWAGGLVALAGGAYVAMGVPVPTTLNDFFAPGTQPEMTDFVPVFGPDECSACHGGFDAAHAPYDSWVASPMGQASRDPAFWACLAVANQDVDFAGDFCLRCHTPAGWLAGNSTPTDGSQLAGTDFTGVNCNFCHRMVDPLNHPGAPEADTEVLARLTDIPADHHSGQYVIDHRDRRRGPYDLGFFFIHDWEQAPFQRSSEMCATCHDVSNPVFDAQPDGTYTLGTLDAPHATHNKFDQFPIERTYSEWLVSDFGDGPIDMGGRFGGTNPLVSSCQDCHMPEDPGQGCSFGEFREDLGTHQFAGGNTWLLNAVREQFPDSETGLTDDNVAASIARTELMLQSASDLELSQMGSDLNVRVINQSGHKLPTGYPEGRRMWVNVQFFDGADQLIDERGAYDFVTADLTTGDTKVYEGKLGITAEVSMLTGLPAGESFHFALNSVWVKDNRIPPVGATMAELESVQAAPVGASYADNQNWDDTLYDIPAGATSAEVRVYYQSVSKEYVEFLRDENTTNTAGDDFYAVWQATGMSTPVEMDFQEIAITQGGCVPADLGLPYGQLDIADVVEFLRAFGMQEASADLGAPMGQWDIADVVEFLRQFGMGCPK